MPRPPHAPARTRQDTPGIRTGRGDWTRDDVEEAWPIVVLQTVAVLLYAAWILWLIAGPQTPPPGH
jgi:hypothetical protein